MKTKFVLVFFSVLLIVAFSGCISKITEESQVLYLNLSITGDYQHPEIDAANTDRYLKEIPILKQKQYDVVVEKPYIHAVMFYNMNKISHYTSVPYNGPGNYLLILVFEKGKTLPKSSNESIIANVQFVDASGRIIGDEYFSVRWV